MSTLRTSLLLSLATASLLACRPADPQDDELPPAPVTADQAADAFARQICASLFACSCEVSAQFASEDACVEELAGNFQADIDVLLGAGGRWDDDCAGALVDTWSDWACLGPSAALAQARYDSRLCPVAKGTLDAGLECVQSPLGDNCREGLLCLSGVCMAAEVPVPVGGQCEIDWNQLPCESGSYCAYDGNFDTQICKALPSAGDTCDPNFDYLCGPSSLNLRCGFETAVCEPLPGAGEPCYEGMCGPNLYCDGGKDFTCQDKFEIGDGCGASSVCPLDASCVSNFCQADPPAACGLAYLNF